MLMLHARIVLFFLFRNSVCIMGRDVEEKVMQEELKKKDQEIAELTASASENEGDGENKVPFFLPRKHSVKNYYTDSD